MDPEQFQKAYSKLVAKAWEDEAFKAELLSDPMKVFKENGIEVPDGMEVKVVENTTDTMHFILPHVPSDELDDDMLKVVCGGWEPALGSRIHNPYRLTPIPGQ